MVRTIASILTVLIVVFSCENGFAQKPERYNSSDIQLKLQKLKVLGNVLYVAAHPDDENTSIISYFANERKVNTAYFSVTRGDGGQNLIGPEIRDKLGLIRTHELLEARKIDHGIQFFSRAVDFGYSKHPDETFNIWDRENVLADLVWVIRRFKPDIIITRFNTEPGTTHGHHTGSAILAHEAMDIAGDPTKFADQLSYVEPWQPKSLYWNAFFWRSTEYLKDTSKLIKVDIGAYNELLGMSYSEISALSRSSHKSQGFGVSGSRGQRIEYLQLEKGFEAKDDVFNGIDISWSRIDGGEAIDRKVDAIISKFNPNEPAGIVNGLIDLRKTVSKLKDKFWKEKKMSEIDELIYAVTGLYLEIKAGDFTATPGETVKLEIEAINRSETPITLESVQFNELEEENSFNIPLRNNVDQRLETQLVLPERIKYTQPYWLTNPHSLGMFQVDDQQQIGKPVNGASVNGEFVLNINGEKIVFQKPIVFKTTDPVIGEVYKPFFIIPPAFATIAGDVNLFNNGKAQKIKIVVRAGKENVDGELRLDLPKTWKVSPEKQPLHLELKNSEAVFEFEVTPPENQEVAFGSPVVSIDGKDYSYNYSVIDYSHIPYQILFEKSESKFVKLELEKGNERIGYLMGAGDIIPENLRQIGYEVDIINDLEFTPGNLDQYETIVLGVRALNTIDRLQFDMPKLFDFVQRGGNLVVQYNTSHRLVTEDIAPYPLQISRDRITVEEADVKILAPEHEIMNYPNKITSADFNDWVQERGLYFPNKWDGNFTTVLSSHDPGEAPLNGGLLVAKYGKGQYIYTGYSWFRELPAGVPGAYRIFVNLISNKR